MSHPVKVRAAITVIEAEGGEGAFELASAVSSIVSAAIIAAFHKATDDGPDASAEQVPPGEATQ